MACIHQKASVGRPREQPGFYQRKQTDYFPWCSGSEALRLFIKQITLPAQHGEILYVSVFLYHFSQGKTGDLREEIFLRFSAAW